MATTVIASIALTLSLLPMLYWGWRRFLRHPSFRVHSGEVLTELESDGNSRTITGATFGIAAVGGGQVRILVNAGVWFQYPEAITRGIIGPRELRGASTIQIEADLPTKFQLHFPIVGVPLPLTSSGQLECRLLFDMETEESTCRIAMPSPSHGDTYRASSIGKPPSFLRPGLLARARSLLSLLGRLLGR